MNILIIATNRHANPVPVMPLGACMVAEATEAAGYNVRLLDLMFAKDPIAATEKVLDQFKPDLIALSVRNLDNNDSQEPIFFPAQLKPLLTIITQQTGAPLIIGGAAIAVMPEAMLRYTKADWAVLGDGETVFPKLVNHLAQDKSPAELPGVAWLDEGKYQHNPLAAPHTTNQTCSLPDLNRWLDADRYRRNMTPAPLQTKLGCHFQCLYCTYRKIEGQAYRLMTPESVSQAVRSLSQADFRDIEFVDNVFNSPYDHAMEICEKLAETEHSARLQTLELNPLFIDDQLIESMGRAGFVGVGITAESASSQVLTGLNKGFSAEHVHRAAEIIERHDMPCLWIFMLGGPGENKQTVEETLRFAEEKIRPGDAAFFNIGIRIYPGTGLESVAREQGVLQEDARDMLEPVFYLSPDIELAWLNKRVRQALKHNMHFLNGTKIGLPFLPSLHRLGHFLGLSPPLWKHSRHIRRGLRLVGLDL